jgi:pilus assembly protein CpaB
MRPISIVIVVFALTLSAVVFFVVPRLMDRGQTAAQPVTAVRIAAGDVLVAARNVPAGTILKSDDVRWQRWPEEGFDPNFLMRDKGADPQKDAVGRVVLRGLGAGEPITSPRLLKAGEAGFLAAALTPGMRGVSVHIDAVSGDGGFIVPGDRVDVLLAERYPISYSTDQQTSFSGLRPSQKQVNSVVLRDVRVLAIDQEMQDMDHKPKVGSTATIEVDAIQAQKLALASQMGALSLALRSLTKAEPPSREGGLVQDTDVSPFLGNLVHGTSHTGGVRVYRGSVAVNVSE